VVATRIKVAAAAGVAFGLLVVGGFAPVVRGRVEATAARYGAEASVESVVPAWGELRLHGVEVRLEGVSVARLRLEEVDVHLFGDGAVALRGGKVELVGAREEVVRQVLAWRGRHASAEPPQAAHTGGRPIAVDGLDVTWRSAVDDPRETASATGVQLSRVDSVLRIEAAVASGSTGFARFEVRRPRVAVARRTGGGFAVRSLTTDGLECELELPAPAPHQAEEDEDPRAGSAAPTAATSSAAAKVHGRDARAAHRPPPADPPRPDDPQSDDAQRAVRVRALARQLAVAVAGALDPTAEVRLGGLHARIHRGDDVLNLGPGLLTVQRKDGRLELDLAPDLHKKEGADDEQAVTFSLSVPEAGGAGEIVADVRGGPIGLSALGVRDGDFGLFDVARASVATRAHVVLAAEGGGVTFDAEGKLHGVSVRSAALSDEPVAGLELAFRAKGELELDGSRLRVDDGEVDLGAIRLAARGSYARASDARRVEGTFDMPLTACQAMLDSAPTGLVPKLKGMRMAGSFALKGRVAFDTADLDRAYKLDWDAANSCRITEAQEAVNVERFRRPFRLTVYTPDGKPTEVETGPGTPDWVSFDHISKFMRVAVLTTEDGGFEHHHGFDHEAIKNSMRENLRKMKFVRGASTISMQLAKNLYLDRGKNVSRKLQEAVLTMYLEQELTKDQILELYFNVIEFGPMVYGIGPASRHYFNGPASDLSLGQALYISSIMPNPKVQHFGAGGAVGTSWMRYLHKLMQIAHERHHIDDGELDEGLRETVVRGSPAPQRSAPGTSADGAPDDPLGAVGPDWTAP
jgi:hypothetical protein